LCIRICRDWGGKLRVYGEILATGLSTADDRAPRA
jgi:hypothetical protein